MPLNHPTPGRLLTTLSSLSMVLGAFISDWSETHVFNPRWPPHAKFHNGQTMSLALALSAATMYYVWWARPSGETGRFAAFLAAVYPLTGVTAAWYPGALGRDPEFGGGNPQLGIFVVSGLLPVLGWWLDGKR